MKLPTIPLLSLLVVLAVGCAGDPYQSALKERGRWSVDVLGVTVDDEAGRAQLSTRISGPPTTSLEQYTVRFSFQDAAGEQIGEVYRTIDVSKIPRGGPQDSVMSFDVPEGFAGVGVDPMAAPTDAQRAKIPELSGL